MWLDYFSLKVGSISANGEREIGELIAKAMEKVGKEGVITISVSCLVETEDHNFFPYIYLFFINYSRNSTMLGLFHDFNVLFYDF